MTTKLGKFFVCISGFTQTRGTYHGVLSLREQLIQEGLSCHEDSRVWLLTWKENFERIATEMLNVCAHHGMKPVVMITGYSYGGWGALQLAKELNKHGIIVHTMILSDPVGRPWYWPRPLPAVTSLLGRNYAFKLHVPPNVKSLHSYFQRTNRPQGHQLVTTNGTAETAPIELQYPHSRMDDAKEYHGKVLQEARRIVKFK